MSSIPVARTTPVRAPRLPRRIVPLLLLGAAIAGLFVMLAVVWQSHSGSIVTIADKVDELSVEEPMHYEQGFFLVKLESGEIIALSDKDPHGFFTEDESCRITWRPDMVFQGSSGWLRGTCTGSNFDRTGQRVSGPSPRAMDRFLVTVSGSGDVRVHTNQLLCAPDYTAADCP